MDNIETAPADFIAMRPPRIRFYTKSETSQNIAVDDIASCFGWKIFDLHLQLPKYQKIVELKHNWVFIMKISLLTVRAFWPVYKCMAQL